MSSFFEKGKLKHGLPSSAYTSADFFRTECDTVFTDNWVFVGFAHELNEPGDARPIMVAGQPVVLIKNNEGKIYEIGGPKIISFGDTVWLILDPDAG